jgi:hypothetical protein
LFFKYCCFVSDIRFLSIDKKTSGYAGGKHDSSMILLILSMLNMACHYMPREIQTIVQAKASLVERTFFVSDTAFWFHPFARICFILPIAPRSIAKATPTKMLNNTHIKTTSSCCALNIISCCNVYSFSACKNTHVNHTRAIYTHPGIFRRASYCPCDLVLRPVHRHDLHSFKVRL